VLLLVVSASELSQRAMPVIVGVASDHWVVIGDAISAGIEARVPARTVVIEQVTSVPG
jgi:hypothetical protein